MLIELSANKESFKKIKFKDGLNIILANRTETSSDKDSRNGLGKTAIIEIIHFCLGGNPTKTLKKEQLEDWEFYLKINLNKKILKITRNLKNKNKVTLEGNFEKWPITPTQEKDNTSTLLIDEWREVLGTLIFNIDNSFKEYKYHPTFRSCISYFARLAEDGGFQSPFKHFAQQNEWDAQVNNAFLLNLDWISASKWQILKDRKKILEQLKTESEAGILSEINGNLGELESEKIRLENVTKKEKTELSQFKIHPQYKQIESDINKLTKAIHEYINDNISEKNLLENYEKSLLEEKTSSNEEVIKIYSEAGLRMPELLKKKLNEVQEFHEEVIKNRKNFLSTELTILKKSIEDKTSQIKILSEKREELMNILKEHHALEEYTNFQDMHIKHISDLENIKNKIQNIKKFEHGKSELKVDIQILKQKTNLDLEERKSQKAEAITLFNQYSEALYNSPGILSIEAKDTGYKFKIEIKRDGSLGIDNMKIFCYDLMLTSLHSIKDTGPKFLIHDSILFADVDERQIAHALILAKNESLKNNFQYICTFNSDKLPYKDIEDKNLIKDNTILELNDKEDNGTIFGFRF